MEIQVNPTRMELNRLRGRLQMATRGHKLLKDKRDELMRQFVDIIKENKRLRESIEGKLADSFANFLLASAVMSSEALEEALMYPTASINVEVTNKNIMSVRVPEITLVETADTAEHAANYGFAATSGELDTSIETLAQVLPELMRLAALEKKVHLLADEIDKTRRRVNALEHVMIPELQDTIKYIRMKLDENERSTLTRLMKIKDIVRKQA
ncbi:MAG TPA: V-type ATP synthase subunit D [Oscillospiraceae bacterium]|nr:V-type ATP synthase subunit D [Oscillospiraceae bacterium]